MIKLLNQKDPFGDSIMVQPRYVIVPVGYGFLMSQILETAQIDVDGIGSHTANALYQYRNRLQVIEEGTLNALAGSNAVPWFVAGDPLRFHPGGLPERPGSPDHSPHRW